MKTLNVNIEDLDVQRIIEHVYNLDGFKKPYHMNKLKFSPITGGYQITITSSYRFSILNFSFFDDFYTRTVGITFPQKYIKESISIDDEDVYSIEWDFKAKIGWIVTHV